MHCLIHVDIHKKKISHSTEKREEEKEAIYLPERQEGKEKQCIQENRKEKKK